MAVSWLSAFNGEGVSLPSVNFPSIRMLNNEKQISKLTLRIQLSNRQEVQSGIENENKRGIASIDLR